MKIHEPLRKTDRFFSILDHKICFSDRYFTRGNEKVFLSRLSDNEPFKCVPILISGPPQSGKTMCLNYCYQHAMRSGFQPLFVTFNSSYKTMPYAFQIELLQFIVQYCHFESKSLSDLLMNFSQEELGVFAKHIPLLRSLLPSMVAPVSDLENQLLLLFGFVREHLEKRFVLMVDQVDYSFAFSQLSVDRFNRIVMNSNVFFVFTLADESFVSGFSSVQHIHMTVPSESQIMNLFKPHFAYSDMLKQFVGILEQKTHFHYHLIQQFLVRLYQYQWICISELHYISIVDHRAVKHNMLDGLLGKHYFKMFLEQALGHVKVVRILACLNMLIRPHDWIFVSQFLGVSMEVVLESIENVDYLFVDFEEVKKGDGQRLFFFQSFDIRSWIMSTVSVEERGSIHRAYALFLLSVRRIDPVGYQCKISYHCLQFMKYSRRIDDTALPSFRVLVCVLWIVRQMINNQRLARAYEWLLAVARIRKVYLDLVGFERRYNMLRLDYYVLANDINKSIFLANKNEKMTGSVDLKLKYKLKKILIYRSIPDSEGIVQEGLAAMRLMKVNIPKGKVLQLSIFIKLVRCLFLFFRNRNLDYNGLNMVELKESLEDKLAIMTNLAGNMLSYNVELFFYLCLSIIIRSSKLGITRFTPLSLCIIAMVLTQMKMRRYAATMGNHAMNLVLFVDDVYIRIQVLFIYYALIAPYEKDLNDSIQALQDCFRVAKLNMARHWADSSLYFILLYKFMDGHSVQSILEVWHLHEPYMKKHTIMYACYQSYFFVYSKLFLFDEKDSTEGVRYYEDCFKEDLSIVATFYVQLGITCFFSCQFHLALAYFQKIDRMSKVASQNNPYFVEYYFYFALSIIQIAIVEDRKLSFKERGQVRKALKVLLQYSKLGVNCYDARYYLVLGMYRCLKSGRKMNASYKVLKPLMQAYRIVLDHNHLLLMGLSSFYLQMVLSEHDLLLSRYYAAESYVHFYQWSPNIHPYFVAVDMANSLVLDSTGSSFDYSGLLNLTRSVERDDFMKQYFSLMHDFFGITKVVLVKRKGSDWVIENGSGISSDLIGASSHDVSFNQLPKLLIQAKMTPSIDEGFHQDGDDNYRHDPYFLYVPNGWHDMVVLHSDERASSLDSIWGVYIEKVKGTGLDHYDRLGMITQFFLLRQKAYYHLNVFSNSKLRNRQDFVFSSHISDLYQTFESESHSLDSIVRMSTFLNLYLVLLDCHMQSHVGQQDYYVLKQCVFELAYYLKVLFIKPDEECFLEREILNVEEKLSICFPGVTFSFFDMKDLSSLLDLERFQRYFLICLVVILFFSTLYRSMRQAKVEVSYATLVLSGSKTLKEDLIQSSYWNTLVLTLEQLGVQFDIEDRQGNRCCVVSQLS